MRNERDPVVMLTSALVDLGAVYAVCHEPSMPALRVSVKLGGSQDINVYIPYAEVLRDPEAAAQSAHDKLKGYVLPTDLPPPDGSNHDEEASP